MHRDDEPGDAAGAAPVAVGSPDGVSTTRLELYWVPLGAGQHVVRWCGRAYEGLRALAERRERRDLYHAALVAETPHGRVTVEVAPVVDGDAAARGVVASGPVGSRLLGRFRIFRYEVRRWSGGVIPDLRFAVASPVTVATDPAVVRAALDVLADVPDPVWGRDELRAGEMWNSNSVIAWVVTSVGLLDRVGTPPPRGRAPGWDAGVRVARRAAALPVTRPGRADRPRRAAARAPG